MGQPTFNQIGTRTRNDNGTEATATWRQNQGVNDTWDADGSTKYRIRFLVDEQNVKAWSNKTFNLYYNLASGGWNAVTNTSPIYWTTSSNYTDGDDCVSRLTGGSGSFLTDNNGMCTGDASATNTGAINNFFELEFVLMVDPAQVSNGQTFQLRVYDGSGALNSYTNEITITIYEISPVLSMTNWRIREMVRWGYTEPGLNTDSGWADALNTSVSRSLDKIVRIRVEVEETAGASFTGAFKWQYRYEAGTWTDITAPGYPVSTTTPRVMFVPSAQFNDADATTNLLSGSAKSFVAGSGDESNNTVSVSLNNQHTEFEGCFMIHKLFDARGVTYDTDTIEFRLVQSGGTALDSYPNGVPTITALMNDGLLGGVFSETVRFEGPICDGNGNLYSLVAGAETQEYPIMLKSTDGGDTWVPQDVANGPTTQDLESLDMVLDTNNNCIHIAQQPGNVWYHQFFVSTHGSTPDTWGTIDEAIDSGSDAVEQCCTIAVRSDGDLICAYTATNTNDRLYYRIKPSGGSWGSAQDLEVNTGIEWSGVACVIGESDTTWFIYNGQDGTCWYKTLSSADSLSGRTQIQSTGVGSSDTLDRVAVIKPIYYDDSGTEHVFFFYKKNDADNKVYCKVYTEGSGLGGESTVSDAGVISDEGAGRNPAAQAVVNASTKGVYLVYADVSTFDIFIDENINEGGWGTDTEIEDGRLVDLLSASLFTHNGGNGGATVVGIIYADGTYGYTGDIYYVEYEVSVTPTLVVQNGSHGNSATAPTLTQVHSITVANGVHSHASTAPILGQVHSLVAQSGQHTHIADAPTLTENPALIVQSGQHSHASTSPALAQVHSITVQDGNHSHASSSPALTQIHVLIVQNGQHTGVADNVILTQAHNITVQNGQHAHVATSPDVIQSGAIPVQSGTHAHSASSPILAQVHSITVQDGLHSHTATNVNLSETYSLETQDGSHGHVSTSPSLTETYSLTIQDGNHNHVSVSVVLTQVHNISLSDGIHAHTADNVSLSQIPSLSVENGLHNQVSTTPVLFQAHLITAQSGTHSHTSSNITLASALLFVQAGIHGHLATSNVSISQTHILTAENGAHTSVSTVPTLIYHDTLNLVNDGSHGHISTTPNLTQVHVLSVSDGLQTHTVTNVSLGGILLIANGVHTHDATAVILIAALSSLTFTPTVPGTADLHKTRRETSVSINKVPR